MTILVLGPTKWRPGYAPRLPVWLDTFLPTGWHRRGTPAQAPIDVRAAIVAHLSRQKHAATMMEMHVRREGETHTALYRRVVLSEGVGRHFVYWPFGAQRSGVDVELGFLLASLQRGESPDVRVFVESAAGTVSGGHFESREKGARTTYYEDLLAYGCPIVEWERYEELWTALRHHAAP